jgi:hypothetical protein
MPMRKLVLALSFAALVPGAVGAQAQVLPDTVRPALDKGRDYNDWRDYYDAGLKLIARQQPRAADPYFTWAARLNPQSAEPVHMHWVALTLASGRLLEIPPGDGSPKDEAERARIDSVLLEAMRMDPFTPRHYARYVYERRPGYWGLDSFTQGYLAYTEGRYDRALKLFSRIRDGERLRGARLFRALSFHEMQRYDSAAAELEAVAELVARENATRLSPSYEAASVYLYGAGVARSRLGDLEGARAALLRALEEDVSMASAHAVLAEVALKRADTAEVLREWAMAIELRPQSAAMHGDYANALRALGMDQAALAEYEKAIALAPYWAAPYFNEALVLDAMRRGPDAVTRYAQFLDRAPRAYAAQLKKARERIDAWNSLP